jgi:Predicted nucleoside-diphosphate-sugar epimerases
MVVRRLAAQGQKVRAFVRPTSNAQHLRIDNVELAFGDLRDAASVDAACKGVDVIIATANTVAPRGGYNFNDVEGQGYRHLVVAAKREAVRQFVFMSAPVTPLDDSVPTFRFKRLIERLIIDSGVPYTIFRGSLFMDDWFALIGSSIPLRGAESHTLRRPFWFSQAFMKGAGHLIENHGVALIPGSGTTRHAFIALDDVASFLVKSVGRPDAINAIMEIGGPQILSWNEVAALFGTVLGKRVRIMRAPATVFRMQQRLLNPLSPAAANLMGMNWIAGTADSAYDMTVLAPKYGISLTSAEQFLREKNALAE